MGCRLAAACIRSRAANAWPHVTSQNTGPGSVLRSGSAKEQPELEANLGFFGSAFGKVNDFRQHRQFGNFIRTRPQSKTARLLELS
jgi:hypothetical protein